MENLPFFLFQGIPECMGYFALSLALLGVPLRWKRIVVAGIILTLVFFTVRSLPFTFGIHSVVGIFLMVIAISSFTYTPLMKSFIAVLATFTTLILLEAAMTHAFFAVTKINRYTIMTENHVLWKLSGLPQGYILLFFGVLTSRLKKPRADAWKI